MAMTKNGMVYEAPKAKVYRFDENDQILTASGETTMAPEYAANALNQLFNTKSTTIEE